MNGARRLILMIVVGILIAASIIVSINVLEQHNLITTQSNSATTITTSKTITTGSLQTGVLAAQITDPPNPPNVPAGVTHVYIFYSDIEAYTTVQNNPVWVTVAKSGSIDMFSILNKGLTLGSAKVYSGSYDQVRFDITNATVTFGGRNYSATVPLNQIVVPLSNGGATVQPNASAGFVIQLTPTVLAVSNGGKPSFEIVTAAQALSIPQSSWSQSLATPGAIIQNINNQTWWVSEEAPISDNLSVLPGSSIFSKALVVILNNTGPNPITISALNILQAGPPVSGGANISTTTIVKTITTVITTTEVSTITGSSSSQTAGGAIGAPRPTNNSLSTVATFLILSNGSVIQPTPGSAPIPSNQVGLTIKPYQNVVLFYVGYINTLSSPNPPYAPQSIVSGQQYLVQVVTPFGSSSNFTLIGSYPS
jgi:hypothetical protein